MMTVDYDEELEQYAAAFTEKTETGGSSVHAVVVVVLAFSAVLLAFHFRMKLISLIERIRNRKHRNYVQLNGSFQQDIESGLSSENFNLQQHNVGDPRAGLLAADKKAIQTLMKDENLSFDQARLKHVTGKFGHNNVGPDGMPLDPKTVTF